MTTQLPSVWRQPVDEFRHRLTDLLYHWWPSSRREMTPADRSAWPFGLFEGEGPAIDMTETEDAIRITAELPGLDEKDFSIEVRGDRLILTGEKKDEHEMKERNYHYSECSYGSFTRVLPLPCEVDSDKAKAKYKRGVLDLTLPKTERAKAQQIRVNVN